MQLQLSTIDQKKRKNEMKWPSSDTNVFSMLLFYSILFDSVTVFDLVFLIHVMIKDNLTHVAERWVGHVILHSGLWLA